MADLPRRDTGGRPVNPAPPGGGPSASPAKPGYRVAVFGDGGRTGRLIVDELLAAGYDVTAAVRDPSSFARDAPRTSAGHGAQVVRADVRDETSVRDAIAGHNAVVSTIGSGRRPDGLHSATVGRAVGALVELRYLAVPFDELVRRLDARDTAPC